MADFPNRFTLERGRLYAMEYTDDSDESVFEHESPIHVFEIEPLKTGKGIFDLTFWHMNYHAGVQHKVYRLRVLRRQKHFLIADRIKEDGKHRYVASIVLKYLTPG